MKDFYLTEKEIQDMINEPKHLGRPAGSILQGMKVKGSRREVYLQTSQKFTRSGGAGEWQIYLRRSVDRLLDFSCGLEFIPEGRSEGMKLLRYNGKSHFHTNPLEHEKEFYDFHIHRATERYQKSYYQDDHFAVVTKLYTNLQGAFERLIIDCNVESDTDDGQTGLFQ